MKKIELTITSENLLDVINCTKEFIKESIIAGNFEVFAYHSIETQINVAGICVSIQMDHNYKKAYIRGLIYNIFLTNDQEEILYKRMISGGLSQAIKLKEVEILRIKNEIALMQENHKNLSVTLKEPANEND